MDSKSKRRSTRSNRMKESESEVKDSSNDVSDEASSSSTSNKQPQANEEEITLSTPSEALTAISTIGTAAAKPLSVKTRSSKSSNATQQSTTSSTIVTRMRQMSTDLKNSHVKSSLVKNESQLNFDGFMNEDSNSSSVSGCPLNSSFNGHLSQSFGSSYKKLKLNNSEASNLKTETVEDETMNCPIQGCTSEGHLDGLTDRHFSFDSCPVYFGMSSSECVERRKQIEKKLLDLEKKLSNVNDKKTSPHKVIKKTKLLLCD